MISVVRTKYAAVVMAAAFATACGCDAVGYPAVEIQLMDGFSTQPLTLANAVVHTTINGNQRPPYTHQASVTSSVYWGCCSAGRWDIQIDRPGYLPFDTTVQVRSQGSCDRPMLKRFQARMFPVTDS